MSKIQWTKPSGVAIETNDTKDIIEYAESMGWKRGSSAPLKPEDGLKKHTVSELREMAMALDIDAPADTKKGELIALILAS